VLLYHNSHETAAEQTSLNGFALTAKTFCIFSTSGKYAILTDDLSAQPVVTTGGLLFLKSAKLEMFNSPGSWFELRLGDPLR
jgi:hypothetical protein